MGKDRSDEMRRLEEIAAKARATVEARRSRLRQSMTNEERIAFDRWIDATEAALELSSRRSRLYFMLEKVIAQGHVEAEAKLSAELSLLEGDFEKRGRLADEVGRKFGEIRDRVLLASLDEIDRKRAERVIARRDRELDMARQRYDKLDLASELREEPRLRVELARSRNRGDAAESKRLESRLAGIDATRRETGKEVFKCMEALRKTAQRYDRFIDCIRHAH